LTAQESGAVPQSALDRDSERDDREVGCGVEENGEKTENDELEKDVAAIRRGELGNEGEKKERSFGIQDFCQDALTERVRQGSGRGGSDLRVAVANHTDAKPDKITGAGIFDGVKSDGGSGENCGDPERGSENVKETADESSDGRVDTFAASASEAASENVENAGSGRYRQKECSGEEDEKTVRVKHGESLGIRGVVVNDASQTVGRRQRLTW
jgi:hypothetical protein